MYWNYSCCCCSTRYGQSSISCKVCLISCANSYSNLSTTKLNTIIVSIEGNRLDLLSVFEIGQHRCRVNHLGGSTITIPSSINWYSRVSISAVSNLYWHRWHYILFCYNGVDVVCIVATSCIGTHINFQIILEGQFVGRSVIAESYITYSFQICIESNEIDFIICIRLGKSAEKLTAGESGLISVDCSMHPCIRQPEAQPLNIDVITIDGHLDCVIKFNKATGTIIIEVRRNIPLFGIFDNARRGRQSLGTARSFMNSGAC